MIDDSPDRPDDNLDEYSELLARYHDSLLSGSSNQFDAGSVDDLSGALDCLKMMERNRQLENQSLQCDAQINRTDPASSRKTLEFGTSQKGPDAGRGESEGEDNKDDDLDGLSNEIESRLDSSDSNRRTQNGRIGRFEIIRRLGAGGNGVVLLANDPKLDRRIALKVPTPSALLRDEFVERFQREARVATRLKHPHIVPVLEAGSVGPIYYIAAEYCDGPNLSEWLVQNPGPMTPIVAAKTIRSLADAVAHAHNRGILHRDIKPSNILFQSVGANFEKEQLAASVRLADFGLARNTTDAHNLTVTNPGAILGTPAYMSPEQAGGDIHEVGVHSDIFSIGVVLYELLTGTAPFERDSPLATLDAVRSHNPQPVAAVVSKAPKDLSAICEKCLQKQPGDRYVTSAALVDDLDRFLHGETVTARPVPMTTRLLRWARRNPLPGTLAALLLVGTIFSGMALYRSRARTLEALAKTVEAKKTSDTNETLALKAVFEARMATIDAMLSTRSQGQRIDSLKLIRQSIPFIDRLNLGEEAHRELRTKAIHSLSLVDVDVRHSWKTNNPTLSMDISDAQGTRYAKLAADGSIEIRSIKTHKTLSKVIPPESTTVTGGFLFSPNGRFFAFRCDESKTKTAVWDFESRSFVIDVFQPVDPGVNISTVRSAYRPFAFSHDSKHFVMASRNQVRLFELSEGKLIKSTSMDPKSRETIGCVAFNPGNDLLAVGTNRALRILNASEPDFENKVTSIPMRTPSLITSLVFSPDSQFICAGAANGTAGTVEVKNGRILGSLNCGGAPVVDLCFHESGALLFASSLDGRTRVFIASSTNVLMDFEGYATHVTSDQKFLATRSSILNLHVPNRSIAMQLPLKPLAMLNKQMRTDDWAAVEVLANAHPDGRLIVRRKGSKISFYDAGKQQNIGEYIRTWPGVYLTRNELFHFTPSGKVQTHLMNFVTTDDHVEVRFGPAKSVEIKPLSQISGRNSQRIERHIRIQSPRGQSYILNVDSGFLFNVEHPDIKSEQANISLHGKLLAVGSTEEDGIRIFDSLTSKQLAKVEGRGKPCFSPDGQLLAVNTTKGCRLLKNEDSGGRTWKTVAEFPATIRLVSPPAGFSPDGRYVAVREPNQRNIRILNARTLKEEVILERPQVGMLQDFRFTQDTSYFFAIPESRRMSIWNFSQMHDTLDELNLGFHDFQEEADKLKSTAVADEKLLPMKIVWE